MPTAYVTAPPEAADDIATALVEEELAACINRLKCRSTFHWEGEVTTEEEVVLLAKTTAERYDELQDRVVELHPYEVPCVERFDEADVLESFGAWLDESVR
ncbi:divalent-cation tolerance protein CutA [Halobacteriales archaeon SW_5_68_122]|nr:MAG: divalent-cation tolerance protein CutA [Halobacteriales archaeon SW_5_68_122]